MKDLRDHIFTLLASTRKYVQDSIESLPNGASEELTLLGETLNYIVSGANGYIPESAEKTKVKEVALTWSNGLVVEVSLFHTDEKILLTLDGIIFDPAKGLFVAYSPVFHTFIGDGDAVTLILSEIGRAVSEFAYPTVSAQPQGPTDKFSN